LAANAALEYRREQVAPGQRNSFSTVKRVGTIPLAVEHHLRHRIVSGRADYLVASRAPVFDTFYTTKPHGTGLGLSIARTIIENHGGKIWAENRFGEGAVFRFTLPLAKIR
jgi:hypothetical protein